MEGAEHCLSFVSHRLTDSRPLNTNIILSSHSWHGPEVQAQCGSDGFSAWGSTRPECHPAHVSAFVALIWEEFVP